IGLCYGPLMVLGSYYIQTQKISFVPFFVSVISGLSVFCLAVLNEIPDYYQDMLVGKRNLVVRLGKQKAILLLKLGLVSVFVLLILGVALKTFPVLAICGVVTVPWVLKSIRGAEKNYDDPKAFRFAVNTIVLSHIVIVLSLGGSFLKG
ncbi:MAG: prenyltransferase, partial [Planctomycetes bacterium]|nr:prenyltransferase [Planctomycetota bacterium]